MTGLTLAHVMDRVDHVDRALAAWVDQGADAPWSDLDLAVACRYLLEGMDRVCRREGDPLVIVDTYVALAADTLRGTR